MRKNYPQTKLPTKKPPNVMSVSYSGSENVNDSSVNVTKSAGNPVVIMYESLEFYHTVIF